MIILLLSSPKVLSESVCNRGISLKNLMLSVPPLFFTTSFVKARLLSEYRMRSSDNAWTDALRGSAKSRAMSPKISPGPFSATFVFPWAELITRSWDLNLERFTLVFFSSLAASLASTDRVYV